MKYHEIIVESTMGTLRVGTLIVDIDSHFIDQLQRRHIDSRRVDALLSRLPQIADDIAGFETGQSFWIHDPASNLSVGTRGTGSYRIKFKTLVYGRPFDSPTPVLVIPSQYIDAGRQSVTAQ